MGQPYMIIDGIRYEQGTVFIFKTSSPYDCSRCIFLYHDTDRNTYCFLTPKLHSADCTTTYPDTRFMHQIVNTDSATDKEIKMMNRVLDRHKSYMTNKKENNTDFDALIIRILAIILTIIFPPTAIILIIIAFSRKNK